MQSINKADVKDLVITEFNEFETKLAEFKDKYDNVVYDLEDTDQEKQARSDRLAIGKVISRLDSKHKDLKAPLKLRTDLIDGERKRIKDGLLNVQGKIKSQIEEHERKIQEHAEMLQGKVDALRLPTDYDAMSLLSVIQIEEKLEDIRSIAVDDSYEHRKADATLAQIDTIKALETKLANRIKYEEEQAELDRLRKEALAREQAEREEKIRAEAAEQAKAEAEKKAQEAAQAAEHEKRLAEQAAQAEINEAKRKQQEAEQAAERAAQAERERIEKEQRQAEAEAERVKRADEERKANLEHRARIHSEAKQALISNGMTQDDAIKIVELIRDGKIKNVQIVY